MPFLSNLFGKSKKDLPENLSPSTPPEKPSPGPSRGGTTLRKQEDLSPQHEQKAGPELTALELAERQNWEVKTIPVWKPGDEILGLYRVEDVLEGGMGRVYIAHHKGWNVKLAIKAPNEMMLSDRNNFARVLREANSWTELGLHPNIAYCYYVRSIEKVPHIFVEYVDGGNLRQWIAEGKCIDYRVSLDLAIQFCHGMEHAHSKGMIHRDIKPENVLMTTDGVLKITDFGLVRTGAAIGDGKGAGGVFGKGMTRLGDVMGTEGYMAPEQFTDAAGVDERADIFSFGVCLYEMCCGAKPYDITIGPRQDAPDPISLSRDAKFPPALAEVLKNCVQWEREKRYNNVKEIRKTLNGIYRALYGEENSYAESEKVDLKADGLNNRALSYLELGQEENAAHFFEEALKADPNNLEATFNYGYYRWQTGKPYRDVLELPMTGLEAAHSSNPDYWRCLAWIHWERGANNEVEKIQRSVDKVTDAEFIKAYNDPHKPAGEFVRSLSESPDWEIDPVAFSPDGRYAFSRKKLWEIATGKAVKPFHGDAYIVLSIAFSPDGRYALSGSVRYDPALRLWEIATGKEVRRFEGHSNCVRSIAFSSDGRHALSGSDDDTLRLWEVGSGKEVRRFEGHTSCVRSVAFSPDGKYAHSGSSDDDHGGPKGRAFKPWSIKVWEIATGKEIWSFEGHNSGKWRVAFSPDGTQALSGGTYKTLRLWDISTGKEMRRFEGHTSSVDCIAFSLDGRHFLSGGNDKTLRLWEIATGKEMRRFEGHSGSVISAAFSPDGGFALSGSNDKTLRLWKIYFGCQASKYYKHPYPLLSFAKSYKQLSEEKRDASKLLFTAENALRKGMYQMACRIIGEVRAVSGYERDRRAMDLLTRCGIQGKGKRIGFKGGWCLRRFEGHTSGVKSVAFSPDGRYALSGSYDKTLRLWEIESGSEIRQFNGHTGLVTSVAFSPDGKYAFSGSIDATLRLWEIATGKGIRRFDGHKNAVNSVSFSPDGKHALSGGWDGILRLWNVETGKEMWRFAEARPIEIYSLAFSPDGRYAILGSEDLHLLEIENGKEVRRFKAGGNGWAYSIAFSPDSRFVISGSGDKALRLWDNKTGEVIRRFEINKARLNSVAYLPDGGYALTGSGDVDNHGYSIILWEINSAKEVRRFEEHTGQVNSVAFSPDGRYALSGSHDQSLRLWELDWEWEFPEGDAMDKGGHA